MNPHPVNAIVYRKTDPQSKEGEKRWYAECEVKGKKVLLPVGKDDPWNFDLENGLPVTVRMMGKQTCKVLSRLRNNKRYVKI